MYAPLAIAFGRQNLPRRDPAHERWVVPWTGAVRADRLRKNPSTTFLGGTMLILILLIVLIVFAVGGGRGYNGGTYRRHGFGLGGILLIVLLVLFLSGAIRL